MKTDYTSLKQDHFDEVLRNYAAYLFADRRSSNVSDSAALNDSRLVLSDREWRYFCLNDIFTITGTKTTPVRDLRYYYDDGKQYPYVTTSTVNNGVRGSYSLCTEQGNVLSVDSAVTGYCAYQHWNFTASDHVEKLTPRFEIDPFVAMFLVTIINMEQYRYNYGRKCSQGRMKHSSIMLPVCGDSGNVDTDFMRRYIMQCSYSKNLTTLGKAGLT